MVRWARDKNPYLFSRMCCMAFSFVDSCEVSFVINSKHTSTLSMMNETKTFSLFDSKHLRAQHWVAGIRHFYRFSIQWHWKYCWRIERYVKAKKRRRKYKNAIELNPTLLTIRIRRILYWIGQNVSVAAASQNRYSIRMKKGMRKNGIELRNVNFTQTISLHVHIIWDVFSWELGVWNSGNNSKNYKIIKIQEFTAHSNSKSNRYWWIAYR